MSARFAAAALTVMLGGAVAAGVAALRTISPPADEPVHPPAAATPATGETARTIAVTAHDNMAYSVPTIAAAPGELLTISLSTISSLPREIVHHNFVLLRADAPASAFVRLAAQSHGHGQHIPAAFQQQVLASTDIAGAGESVSTTFRAPVTPGSYVYLCSVPGHFAGGMKGTLVVR